MTAILLMLLSSTQSAYAGPHIPAPFRYIKGACESFLMMTPSLPADIDAETLRRDPEAVAKLVESLEGIYVAVPFGANSEEHLNRDLLRGYHALMEYSTDLAARLGTRMLAATESWSARGGFIELVMQNLKVSTHERMLEFLQVVSENPVAGKDAAHSPDFGSTLLRVLSYSMSLPEASRPDPWTLFRLGYRRMDAEMEVLQDISDHGASESRKSDARFVASEGRRLAARMYEYFRATGDIRFQIYFEMRGRELHDMVLSGPLASYHFDWD